ncbi:MAG TPA: hypothetical protein VGA08_01780 [Candidatus Saccharimonadales bacterium]
MRIKVGRIKLIMGKLSGRKKIRYQLSRGVSRRRLDAVELVIVLMAVPIGLMRLLLTSAGANDVFRVTTYEFEGTTFTNATVTMTLNNTLSEDYFVMINGGTGSTGNRGGNVDSPRVTMDPYGNFSSSTSNDDELELTRGSSGNEWTGAITVVECLDACASKGFVLSEVRHVSLGAGSANTLQTVTDTLSGNHSSQTVPFGGRWGGGISTSDSSSTSYAVTLGTRVYKSSTNQITIERYGGTSTAPVAADIEVYIVEWGSEWTVQESNFVDWDAGGNGADITGEYTTNSITTVDRANTWVWKSAGTSEGNGLGQGSFGKLVTLGDGVNQNASESTVALGSEQTGTNRRDTVYVLTHDDLVTDYRFLTDASTGLTQTTTVDGATDSESYDNSSSTLRYTEGYRVPQIWATSSGTGTAFSSNGSWFPRITADTTLKYDVSYAVNNHVFWIQVADFAGIQNAGGGGGGPTTENLTQKAYIWENDDGASADINTQLAAANTALTDVRRGNRLTLRAQIDNDGEAVDSDIGLFYDRGDGYWTKVGANLGDTTAGDCDSFDAASIGSTNWDCTTIFDGADTIDGFYSSLAFGSDATPYLAWHNDDAGGDDLIFAEYVGSGGDCDTIDDNGGSDAWECTIVHDGTNTFDAAEVSMAAHGSDIYIAYFNGNGNDELYVANYVGSGGNCDSVEGTAGSDAWQCTLVFDGADDDDARWPSIAIDSTGKPYVAFHNVESSAYDTVVAEYVGSGGNCDGFDGVGGSDAWQCTTVFDETSTAAAIRSSTIVIDQDDNPIIAFPDQVNLGDQDLIVAQRVGSGGNCDGFDGAGGSDAWQCTMVYDGSDSDDTTNEAEFISLAIAPDGAPWVSFHNDNLPATSNDDLIVANFVGSGGNCDGFDDTGGSDAWQCTLVVNGDNGHDIIGTSLAFDAAGVPWVSFNNGEASGQDDLVVARYVGSGGNCDGFDDTGGSDAWQCETIIDGGEADDFVRSQIAFGPDGKGWIITNSDESGGDDVILAEFAKSGEFSGGLSPDKTTGDSLSESHSDMTSTTDTTSRDDADCLTAGATWNNGLFTEADEITSLTLPDGTTTVQCTEIAYIVDTAQAAGAVTYRFLLATEDGLNPSRSSWRGISSITSYPTLTTAESVDDNHYIYSKGADDSLSSTVGHASYLLDPGRSPHTNIEGNCVSSTDKGYCGVFRTDGLTDGITAAIGANPNYVFAVRFTSNSVLPSASAFYLSSVAPSTNSVVLQAYRFGGTNAWETITTDSASSDCSSANCSISGSPSGTVSEYYQAESAYYWIYFRLYQTESGASPLSLSLDNFISSQTGQLLRHGRSFREGQSGGYSW